MATLWLNDVDIEAEFPGLYLVDGLPDLLHRTRVNAPEVALAGLPGGVLAAGLEVPSAEFRVTVAVDGGTLANNRAILEAVNQLCGTTPVTIRTADRPDRIRYARLLEARWIPQTPALVSEWSKAELVFRSEAPYWRERWPLPVAFATTYVPVPMWGAPTAPVIELWGPATQPLDLFLADHTGRQIRQSRFTLDVSTAANFLRIYTEAWGMAIFKSIGGVLTQDDTLLDGTVGLFPGHFDPADADPRLGTTAFIKVTAAAGTPRGRVLYPRQAL